MVSAEQEGTSIDSAFDPKESRPLGDVCVDHKVLVHPVPFVHRSRQIANLDCADTRPVVRFHVGWIERSLIHPVLQRVHRGADILGTDRFADLIWRAKI